MSLVRASTSFIERGPYVEREVFESLTVLLKTRAAYRRTGYPRAGGFDRLLVVLITPTSYESTNVRLLFLHPSGYSISEGRNYKRTFLSFFILNGEEVPNVFVGAVLRRNVGTLKYGPRDDVYGEVERGAFLQALHVDLCRRSIPNRIHGGIRREAYDTLFALPPGLSDIVGVIA